MDSSPPHYNQHFSHAQSSPNLFSAYRPQPQNESSSSDVANSSSSPFQPPLRRGISDNVPTAASTRYANSAANHARRFPQVEGSHSGGGGEDGAATRETWMDFLRGTGSGDPSGNSRENNYTPNRSFVERNAGLDPLGLESVEQSEPTGFARYPRNRFDPTERYTRRNLNLTFDGAADHPPGMNLSSSSVARHPPPRHSSMQFDAAQTSSSPLATTAALAAYRERKRRLTDITPSGREGGSGPRTSIAGPTVIDLTSSPEGPRRMTVTRRGSAGGPAGSRRTSSSGMSGTAVARPGSSSRNGTGRERNAQEEATRRPSDIVLPKWQPDSEVTKCPVCSNAFSFFYRKHHCR